MELVGVNDQFYREQREIIEYFSSKLNIDLTTHGLHVLTTSVSSKLYKYMNILHQGFNHTIGEINNRYIIILDNKNYSNNDCTLYYSVIKPDEFSITHRIVKEMTEYFNNLDKNISVYKFNCGRLSLVNTIKAKKYKPLESEFYRDFIRRYKIIKSYDDKGVTFNTNLLITGPPGSGKTRFIMDIAVYLKHNIYNLSMSKNDINSSGNVCNCIFMIEEIDKEMSHDGSFIDPLRIDESQLLCFLDGNVRHSSTILIMTCNDYNRVKRNKIFSRKGRINKVYEFGGITIEQCKHLIGIYYKNTVNDEQIQQFYDRLPKKSVTTIAMLSYYIQESVLNEVAFADLDPKLVYINDSEQSYLYQ